MSEKISKSETPFQQLEPAYSKNNHLSKVYVCIAIEQASLIADLYTACQRLPDIKKRPEYHLTLRFIKTMPDNQLKKLLQGIVQIAANYQPFQLTLSRPGHFPGIIWHGVEASENLDQLHTSINDLVISMGLPDTDFRPYIPHITLSRRPGAAQSIDKISKVSASWQVETLEIRQSVGDNLRYLYRVFLN